MPKKKEGQKKEGMMGKAIRGLNKTRVATGGKLVKEVMAEKRKKAKKKPTERPTASAAKAKAEKEAIRKRVAAKVAKAKKRK